jgi:hypothetical protein
MKAWMTVLLSSIAAILAAAVAAVPELANAPRSEIGPILLAHWPVLAVAAVAVYALCALFLTTTALIVEILRFRLYLTRTFPQPGLAPRNWGAAFAEGSAQVAPSLTHLGGTDSAGLFDAKFSASEARGQISRLYYIALARSHFPSALIMLAGIVALGLAHDHGSLPPLHPAAIPTLAAAMIMTGLVLLYILGRIAVDVAAERLFESMPQLAGERAEIGLLRRAVELLEVACNIPSNGQGSPAPPPVPERLVAALEHSQKALADAASRLSAHTEVLQAAVQASEETLETAIRTATTRHPLTDDHDKIAGDATALPELKAAVEELTAVLRRLGSASEAAQAETLIADPARPSPKTPRLARELHQLLQEIEGAR